MSGATIKEALRRASLRLKEAGVDNPHAEAQLLLCHCLGCSRAYLYAHDEELLPDDIWNAYLELVKRRAAGEPYAYLTGQKEFMGLAMTVSPAVLIPRPETETLVESVLKVLPRELPLRILDVGTGSGAIAVSLAVFLPRAEIFAADKDPRALQIAAENAARHKVADRVFLFQGDLYEPVTGQAFDAVVSNPPYVDARGMRELPDTVRLYEPRGALYGGEDGLCFYRRLTGELSRLARPPHLLAFEVGSGQAEEVASLCRTAGYDDICIIPDLAGKGRIVLALRPGPAPWK